MKTRILILTLLFGAILVPHSVAQVANNNAGWEMWMARIYDLVAKNQSGDSLKRIQVVTIPRRAEWQTAKANGPYNFCTFADSIPRLGAEYEPTSARVSEQYAQFVDGLNIPPIDNSKKAQLKAARAAYYDERSKLDTLNNNAQSAWDNWYDKHKNDPSNELKTYRLFLANRKWGALIGQQETAVAAANQSYTNLIVKQFKGFQQVDKAIDNAHNDAYFSKIQNDQGSIYICPQYGLTPTVETFIAQPTKVSWDFYQNKERKTIESSSLGGSASISIGFFSFGGSGGGSWTRINEEKEKVDFQVEFKSFGRLTLNQGPWFSKVLINTFHDGTDFIPNSPITKGGKLWWPDGRFAWIPKEVVLAYQPKFTITLSKSRYEDVKKAVSGGGGFSIGPFSFGASGGSNTENISYDDGHNTVTLEDTADSPTILAVINEPLGEQ
jgi:uncharacterized membrane protein YgcG